ncbi:aminotransferase class V-fold PLP-dependent enzyme [Novosphingobium sp.]|uniref:aminotransferase class V-fold PLP-dependent enzyme n=1 Tax=Novosphingobium sp. TaxID=1874826 RepID=UPI00262E18A0|nr:aminotransferase class V-fold PLP-dependent enzyme [Novosphingobium sp.]
MERRRFLASAVGVAGLPAVEGRAARARLSATGPRDEAYWQGLAAQFDRPPDVIQLEHGNWGAMARPVGQAYARMVERVNRDTSLYARTTMGADLAGVRRGVADLLGVAPGEVALTRNATEALTTLIMGYRGLRPGDAVLYADHDYDAMQHCMAALGALRGVEAIRIALPHPASRQQLIDGYAAALAAHPNVRLLLLTHLGHRSGLVLPVAEIVRLARARGAEVIVDAAHSLGQLDFTVPQIEADFVGVNLHKWIGAPLGVGAMIVRGGRHGEFARHPAADPAEPDGIDALVHTGTIDFAAVLTVPRAIAFQNAIGAEARAARLRELRDRWVLPLREHRGIDILTPDDPRLHGAITAFRIKGSPGLADHQRLAARLLDEFRIFTVVRQGLDQGACIRVTPALANNPADCDRLAQALQALIPTRGRSAR